MSSMPREINLGCGRQRRAGCWNVDISAEVEPDLVWNLEQRPYPLPRAWFRRAYAMDVIEHLEDIGGFLGEVHEILEPGGILEITTPHFSCANAFTDPTHRHQLGYFSFDYFTAASPLNFYVKFRFEIVERILVFRTGRVSRLVAALARRNPALYERRFAWIWPAWFLIVRLRRPL